MNKCPPPLPYALHIYSCIACSVRSVYFQLLILLVTTMYVTSMAGLTTLTEVHKTSHDQSCLRVNI